MQSAGRTPFAEAVRAAVHNPVSRFPRSSHQPDRIQGVAAPAFTPSFTLAPGQTVFTIGSCFARNIEEHLAPRFDVPTLAFTVPEGEWQGTRANGILNKYAPVAIRTELELATQDADEDVARRCLVDTPDGNVVDLQLAANVAVSPERGRQRRRQVRDLFRQAFSAGVVVITLGQTESWWDAETELYANVFPPASVHRHHQGRFFFEQLSYERCLDDVERAVELLLTTGTAKHILLSVSPVPLGRTFTGGDALTAYLASKSVLRVVAENVTARYDAVDYLPTFEAVMLTDRSRAFDRNLHIPDDVVGTVVEAALRAYVDHAAVPA